MVLSMSTFAQTQGSVFVGGMFGANGSSTSTTTNVNGYKDTQKYNNSAFFKFLPEVGYYVTDNIAVGAKFKLGKSKDNTSFGIGPFVQASLPIVAGLNYVPSVFAGYIWSRTKGNDPLKYFGMEFKPAAIEFSVLNNMGINLSLLNLTWTHAKVVDKEMYDTRVKQTVDNCSWSIGSPTVGVRLYF